MFFLQTRHLQIWHDRSLVLQGTPPPVCKKLVKHGNEDGPNGCTAGRTCDKFHKKIRPKSLKKRECLNPDCKLRHVTGRKRQLEGTRPTYQPRKHDNCQIMEQKLDCLLEALRTVRAEIMEELDRRTAATCPIPPVIPPLWCNNQPSSHHKPHPYDRSKTLPTRCAWCGQEGR